MWHYQVVTPLRRSPTMTVGLLILRTPHCQSFGVACQLTPGPNQAAAVDGGQRSEPRHGHLQLEHADAVGFRAHDRLPRPGRLHLHYQRWPRRHRLGQCGAIGRHRSPPIADDDGGALFYYCADAALSIPASALLANDTDPMGLFTPCRSRG